MVKGIKSLRTRRNKYEHGPKIGLNQVLFNETLIHVIAISWKFCNYKWK